MPLEGNGDDNVELRPLIGLLAGVPEATIEHLTIEAIKTHRELVDKAERLFQELQAGIAGETETGSAAHIAYLDATIKMHAQMSALTTLLRILGRTPQV